jgi:hypothetical protein
MNVAKPQRMVPHKDKSVERKEGVSLSVSPLLKLSTTAPETKLPPMMTFPATIMSTTDLVLRNDYKFDDKRPSSSQEDYETGYTPSGSPIELRVGAATIDDRVPRSMPYNKPRTSLAPESAQYGASPSSQYGTSPGSSRSSFGSPRSSMLAPDSQGNPIPSDAKWTKISRILVSTEVLDQDKRRYEA